MNKQMTMSQISDELAEAKTRKKEFLELMNRLIPWGEWKAIITPCYYKGERGNKPYEIELMLRIHTLQKLYDLSDEGVANEVIDSRAFSQFCGVDSSNQVPDGDTIGRFRNILVRNHLEERLFNQVVETLAACGLLLRKGTIVDSTLISAPSSTHNQEKKRDPEAHSVKKGSQWHFGYKEHVGVEAVKAKEHEKSSIRSKVEHVFAVAKRLFKYHRTRYRGLEKVHQHSCMIFALANLFLARNRLSVA